MKIRNVAVLSALAASVVSAQAQTTVIARYDGGTDPQKAGYTVGILRPEVEVWDLLQNTPYHEYEVGRLHPIKAGKDISLLLGGYLSYFPGSQQVFVLPWGIADMHVANTHVHAELAYYQPLNGGTPVLWSNDCSLNRQLCKGVEGGMVTTFWWPRPGTVTYGVGPKISADLGHRFYLNARAILWGKQETQYRIALARTL